MASTPSRDDAHLRALAASGVLDAEVTPALDRLARVVARGLGVPVGRVNILTGDLHLPRGVHPDAEGAREPATLSPSCCQHVVRLPGPLVVSDARLDPRFAGSEVTDRYGVVAYLGAPVRGPDGSVLGTVCGVDFAPRAWSEEDLAFVCDIAACAETEIRLHHEAAEAVRAVADRLNRVLEAGAMTAMEWDPPRGTVWLSDTAPLVLGVPAGVHDVAALNAHFDATDLEAARQGRADKLASGQEFVVRARYRRPDTGAASVLEIRSSRPDPARDVIHGIARDVTSLAEAAAERARAEAAAAESQRILDALMRHVPEGITVADAPDLRIRRSSAYGDTLTGIEAGAYPTTWEVYHLDGVTLATPEEQPLTRATQRGETVTNEEWLLRGAEGHLRVISCNAGPIRDADGRITGGVVAWRDVTEQKRAEEALRHAHKMEAVGQLAGGMAHELNNMLGAAIGFSQLALKSPGEERRVRTCLERSLEALQRAASVNQQVLAFSRRQVLKPTLVEVNDAIRAVAPMLERALSPGQQLRTVLGEAVGQSRLDRSQLEQALLNLTLNARDAMPDGGVVTVATERLDLEEPAEIEAGHWLAAGRYARVTVVDTGCGMDEATRARAIEPFYTTKPAGLGRGLGLSTVYGTVRQSGGAVVLRSQPGHGTTVALYLPSVAGSS